MQKKRKKFHTKKIAFDGGNSAGMTIESDFNDKNQTKNNGPKKNKRNYSASDILKFLIPSIIGIIIFMLPI